MNEAPRSPWHAGERQMQARAGVAGRMETLGSRLIRDALPEQHRLFYALLPFIVLAAVDGEGAVWATALAGPPGFLRTPTPGLLHIAARPGDGDPVAPA